MKKLLVTALVGAAVVGVVVVANGAVKAQTPEGRVCTKMGELCGSKASAGDFDRCVDGMKDLRKASGDVAFDRSAQCVEEAKSCGAVAGCMMGGAGVGVVGEMMKGFGTALTK